VREGFGNSKKPQLPPGVASMIAHIALAIVPVCLVYIAMFGLQDDKDSAAS
jgi:hypothetical protein